MKQLTEDDPIEKSNDFSKDTFSSACCKCGEFKENCDCDGDGCFHTDYIHKHWRAYEKRWTLLKSKN